jgi:hypothetical protein
MKFQPGQEVTPNIQNFKFFQVFGKPRSPKAPEFGKTYIVEGYNKVILCNCGDPTLKLKDFPVNVIFCQNCFDALPDIFQVQQDLGDTVDIHFTSKKKD